MSVATRTIETKVPARMDRLPWSRWHWLVVFALGTVWVLDGLEVTIKGAVGPSLRDALGFSTVGVAGLASIYLFGAVCGAILWGYLTDRYGRKNLFLVTIGVYMVGVLGTSVTGLWIFGDGFEYLWFGVFRFITGLGIGGEYAAINSAIDELVPARVRGRTSLIINGSYWVGTAFGAIAGAVYLNVLPQDIAFRAAFGMGLILAVGISLMRMYVPESPRWLMTHGYVEEAERTVEDIERQVKEKEGLDELPTVPDEDAMTLRERRSVGFIELGRTLFRLYPQRSIVGFTIMLTQAFLYNAIFFTFGLMLTTYFDVSAANVGFFLVPFAVGNFLGPVVLGRFFDSRGRRVMIPFTFALAGTLTILVGFLFASGVIVEAWLMTLGWVVIFFFASAGASAGYLTVSETFPLEVRAMAIALFYALATGVGGIFGPLLYGALISSGNSWSIFIGYSIGGVLMLIGAIVHRKLGVEAAQMELEDVAAPLSEEEAEGEQDGVQALEGPAGLDVGDPEAVRAFQRARGIEPDGVVGPVTAGALRAEVAGGEPEGSLAVVDVTDPEAIRAFQRRCGLDADACIGPATRGALRFAARHLLVDPVDTGEVRDFQAAHGLTVDGVIGEETQSALAAVHAETTGGDPSAGLDGLDPLDASAVERFQRVFGLDPSGDVDEETRGALRARQALTRRNGGLDPSSADSIRAFQEGRGLEADGVLGERTREALASEREGLEAPETIYEGFGVDALRAASVKRFQRAVGLEDDGCVGARTRRALRHAPHLLVELDPTDEESVRAFQRDQRLTTDGTIGPQTQGALSVVMRRRAAGTPGIDDDSSAAERAAQQIDGLLAFDPSDPASVSEFQRGHGLTDDGIIGPRTRSALRAALVAQEETMTRAEPRRRRPHVARPHFAAGAPLTPHLPGEDREFDRHLGQILMLLRKEGAMDERDLRAGVDARRWGPGRFRYILRTALDEGVVRRSGRRRYSIA